MRQDPIAVLGVPSGGTSAVAGVLAALGVNMGHTSPDGCAWHTHECTALGAIVSDAWPANWGDSRVDTRMTIEPFRSYVSRRPQSSPWGFKHPCAQIILQYAEAHFSNRLTIVSVERPLETSITSWVRRIRKHDPTPGAEHGWAAFITKMWSIKQAVWLIRPPDVTIRFQELLDEPEEVITELARELGLDQSKVDIAVATIAHHRR